MRWRIVVVLWWVLVSAGCGPTPSGPLERAAFEGDAGSVASIVARQAPAPDDATAALIWASRRGHTAVIAVLLDHGADPNRMGPRGRWTPLMHALHTRRLDAARLLLARGANPAVAPPRNSALQMAALDDETEFVTRLLSAGVPRDQQVRALDVAVRGGALVDLDRGLFGSCKTGTVRLLLAHDPTLGATVQGGLLSSLWWARWQGCAEMVALVTGGGGQERPGR